MHRKNGEALDSIHGEKRNLYIEPDKMSNGTVLKMVKMPIC